MPKTIIVIEDDPDILDMMIYILKDEGYEVIGSVDCRPLDDIFKYQPDLILLDNRLPDVSGKDACLKLKEDAETRHIPVVLVSAHQNLQQMAGESMADGYVSKPFDLEELLATVRRFA
jgi:DNA-binding response OmpR family regulator